MVDRCRASLGWTAEAAVPTCIISAEHFLASRRLSRFVSHFPAGPSSEGPRDLPAQYGEPLQTSNSEAGRTQIGRCDREGHGYTLCWKGWRSIPGWSRIRDLGTPGSECYSVFGCSPFLLTQRHIRTGHSAGCGLRALCSRPERRHSGVP